MTTRRSDVTRIIDLVAKPGTGPVRERRPIYVDLLPPCNNACPAGENIQAWLAHAQAGRHHEAWLTLVRDNPLPAVHGRVCYHPCESHCNREPIDSAVSIHAVERFLGDMAGREGWQLPIDAPASGKRVLVVGAGPSGLSAAYHLARLGHAVEIHEAGPLPGGMMHFGIPAYRLPREELMKEVRAIEAMGVAIVLNHKVDDLRAEMEAGRFDAAFLAIGAHIGKRIDIPARDASRMVTAVSLLRDAATGAAPKLGRRVVVYGAGNTAMDAARTAKRLGAEEAIIVYRSRPRAHEGAGLRGPGGDRGGGEDQVADQHQVAGGHGPHRRGDGARRRRSAEANRPPRDPLRGRGGAGGRPGDRQRLPPQDPGHRIPVRRRGGRRAQHDDRPSRDLRRRRHGADRADGDRGRRPRQEGGAPHRRLVARKRAIDRRPSTRSFRSRCCTCRSTATRSDRCRRRCRSRSASPGSRRCRLASARRRRPTRRSGACPAGTASSATSAMRRAPSRRSRSSSPATGTATSMTGAPAAPSASTPVRATRSR